MTAAAETRSAAQAKREAELVSAADRGPRAFYGAAGYGKLAGILGGTVAIAVLPLGGGGALLGRVHPSTLSTARNASCGISTEPTDFMRFLPSFCFSNSFRLREMSPP